MSGLRRGAHHPAASAGQRGRRTAAATKQAGTKLAAQASGTARRHPFVLLILGLLASGLCALLILNTASAAEELRRHDLAATDQDVAAAVVGLQAQVAASAAPGALANAAARLGMVPDPNPAVISQAPDGSMVVLVTGVAATGAPVATVAPTPAPVTSAVPTPTAAAATSAAAGVVPSGSTPAVAPSPPAPPTPEPSVSTLPGGPR